VFFAMQPSAGSADFWPGSHPSPPPPVRPRQRPAWPMSR
jgi:hypothetical protein